MIRFLKLAVVPLLAILLYFVLPAGLTSAARATLAMTFLMGVWWLTETIPIPVTSLLPIALFPIFGIADIKKTTASYGDKLIFLFLGGFMVASAMQKWNLHRRIALNIIRCLGNTPSRIVGGVMTATAFLSLWMANGAVAMMMLPIGLSLIELVCPSTQEESSERKNFAVCMMLGIAYASSIGGVGTLIGTPPNTLLSAFVGRQYGTPISFGDWMKFGMPLVILFLPFAWFLLTKWLYPIHALPFEGGKELIQKELAELGSPKPAEWIIFCTFLVMAFFWTFRAFLTPLAPSFFESFDDTVIAVLGALVLFMIPACDGTPGRVLDWKVANQIPWGLLLLFGGGLSLAAALESNGVALAIGRVFEGMSGIHPFWPILVTTTVIICVTEFMSNTATTATFLPVVAAVATGIGLHPYYLLVPTTLAASFGFMMPVGTAPNAIAFGSGYLTTRQMARAGIWLNLTSIVLISTLCYFFLDRLLPLPPIPPR